MEINEKLSFDTKSTSKSSQELQKRFQENHEKLIKENKIKGTSISEKSSKYKGIIRILGILSMLYFVYVFLLYILNFIGFDVFV